MANKENYVVILPYFCQEEIDRYLLIADWLRQNCETPLPCHFLLAASPKAQLSRELYDSYSQLGDCTAFQCPTQIFGYPEGPTAMFWDTMDYINDHFGDTKGFSLWLESDMAFTQPNWLESLAKEWNSDNQVAPLMMGCLVPKVYKHRLFRKRKLVLDSHINGGACYALDFARRMPPEAREGVFDMAVYRFGLEIGGVKATQQISFSSTNRVRRDLLDPNKCILHGFMQEKDEFIAQCVKPVTEQERRSAAWNQVRDQWEVLQRRVRVCFVRRGREAVLENVLLAQHRAGSTRKAA